MERLYYIGPDVYEKTVSYCIKTYAGTLVARGQGSATRAALTADVCPLPAQQSLEGKSLVPLLNNRQPLWNYPARTVEARADEQGNRGVIGRSLRTERFRYTEWGQGE